MAILYQRRTKGPVLPGHVKQQIEAYQYDIETVQEAINTALAQGAYMLAQQIMDKAGYDLCVLCVTHQAVDRLETPHGELQLCADCGLEFQAL
jgi:hypothetical protein